MKAHPPVGARSRAIARTLTTTALLLLIPAIATAAPPTGKLQGLAGHGNTDVNLTATITGTGNDRSVLLEFRDPFSCKITAPFLKEDATTSNYRIKAASSSGGWCDGLKPDVVFTTIAPVDKQPAWRITFSSKNNDWTGTLTQSPSP